VARGRPAGRVRRVPCGRGARHHGGSAPDPFRGAGRARGPARRRGPASGCPPAVPREDLRTRGVAWGAPAGRPGRVASGRDRRLGSFPAGSRGAEAEVGQSPGAAVPGRARRGEPQAPALREPDRVPRCAGSPGCPGRLAFWARGLPRAGRGARRVSTRSWGSAGAAAAEFRAAEYWAAEYRAGPGPCRAPTTGYARGKPPRARGGGLRAGDPPGPPATGICPSPRWRTPLGPPGRTRRPPRQRQAPAWSCARAGAWPAGWRRS